MKHAYFVITNQCGKGLIVFNELNVANTRMYVVFDKDLLCFLLQLRNWKFLNYTTKSCLSILFSVYILIRVKVLFILSMKVFFFVFTYMYLYNLFLYNLHMYVFNVLCKLHVYNHIIYFPDSCRVYLWYSLKVLNSK